MTRQELGKKKVVYSEGSETRALRGVVVLENGFCYIKTDRYRDPILINQNMIIAIND